jgi:hypothetical protein
MIPGMTRRKSMLASKARENGRELRQAPSAEGQASRRGLVVKAPICDPGGQPGTAATIVTAAETRQSNGVDFLRHDLEQQPGFLTFAGCCSKSLRRACR